MSSLPLSLPLPPELDALAARLELHVERKTGEVREDMLRLEMGLDQVRGTCEDLSEGLTAVQGDVRQMKNQQAVERVVTKQNATRSARIRASILAVLSVVGGLLGSWLQGKAGAPPHP